MPRAGSRGRGENKGRGPGAGREAGGGVWGRAKVRMQSTVGAEVQGTTSGRKSHDHVSDAETFTH